VRKKIRRRYAKVGKLYLEPSGNLHWWPRSEAGRKGVLKVLKLMDRVLTPGNIAKRMPPLPPKLWRKMRRLYPDLYHKEDAKTAHVKVPLKEYVRFLEACDKWQVTSHDAMLAFMVLMADMVAQLTETGDADDSGAGDSVREPVAEQRE